jgi:hypothetical protein
MSCKVDPKDYTPEQKKAVEDFHNLIASKIGVPCIVYDPPPSSCSHTECNPILDHPKSFLSKFSKEELDAIIEMGKNVPEICGNGE